MREIKLTKNKITIVDDEDYDYLNQWKWYASFIHNSWYAVRDVWKPTRKSVFMHRLIVDAPDELMVDHWDTDGLNNQRKNLRICTNSQNRFNRDKQINNTSGFKGVVFQKKAGNWRSQIGFNGKKIHLGCFSTAQDAAHAYDQAAKQYFGEFARTNF